MRTTIRHAQSALLGCLLVSLAASASAGGGLSVPKQLQKAATERKAELSKLKVGLGPFRHFSQAKLTDVGVSNYVPVGEPVTFDFSTTRPSNWEAGTYSTASIENPAQGKPKTSVMELPAEQFKAMRAGWRDYYVEARIRLESIVDNESYGLVFSVDKSVAAGWSRYVFQIKKAGVGFLMFWDGKWSTLQANVPLPTGVLAADGWDTLRVSKQGSKLHCSVNGQEVFAVSGASPPFGLPGVYLNDKGKAEFDDVVLQKLELSQEEVAAGSGYDYTEEVLEGLVKSGLFLPAQIGISNNPAMESWDYLIGADTMDSGLGYYILREGNPKPAQARVSLPAEGNRAKSMTQFGEYLAYELAGKALGISGEGKP